MNNWTEFSPNKIPRIFLFPQHVFAILKNVADENFPTPSDILFRYF